MLHSVHDLYVLFAAAAVCIHWAIWADLRSRHAFLTSRWGTGSAVAILLALSAWIVWSVMDAGVIYHPKGPRWLPVAVGATLTWVITLTASYSIWRLSAPVERLCLNPQRRKLLLAARSALTASPFAGVAYGIVVGRTDFHVREVEVAVPGLPGDLQGLRLVQVSDIHLGAFLAEKELARVIDMANELRGHIALVTGDLITTFSDPLDASLRQVARLRADAGVWGCHGNHELHTHTEQYATREALRLGVRFLRHEAAELRFGDQSVNLVGVDYQEIGHTYLNGVEHLVRPRAFNILLSHNPDVFPVAAKKGFGLTVSGHTHGGQIRVEILHQSLSPAHFFTPYTYGLYYQGSRAIYVTRGIGTVGIPVRLGAPPEVALIRLAAS